jgi:hypothetical protein
MHHYNALPIAAVYLFMCDIRVAFCLAVHLQVSCRTRCVVSFGDDSAMIKKGSIMALRIREIRAPPPNRLRRCREIIESIWPGGFLAAMV